MTKCDWRRVISQNEEVVVTNRQTLLRRAISPRALDALRGKTRREADQMLHRHGPLATKGSKT
ncbi:hypothetical protein MTMBA_06020 [Moorella thermoacetica]